MGQIVWELIENVIGAAGDHTIIGDQNGNRLEGGPGYDVVSGRRGLDTLVGGPGDDSLTVSAAPRISRSGKTSVTTGSSALAGARPRIEFHALFADFATLMAATVDDGSGNGVIGYDERAPIVLEHVAKASLHAADFSFA